MIHTVIFDMGGVLVSLDRNRCIESFRTEAGFESIGDFLDLFHQKGFIGDLEKGDITPDDFFNECIRRSRPGTTKEVVRDCFNSLLTGMIDDAVKLLMELHDKYDICILSNNNPISRGWFKDHLMSEYGIDGEGYFKNEFYSYEMRILKPSPEIYRRVIDTLGCKPEEILFIDDSVTNAEAARAAGITTLWLQPGMNISEEVHKLLNNEKTLS